MTENEKTTALIPSVGADGGQPLHDSTNQSIPHETCESNPPEENIEEMREKIRRMNDPHYLHTVSMTELYQTAYKSRPPVIDGLLYSGAYILAGAPKIGKPDSSLVFHTDRGGNYRSKTMNNYMRSLHITHSFSRAHVPYDNSVMESFFASMKREELYRTKYRSEADFRSAVDKYIIFYNTKRPHKKLQYKTPEQKEEEYALKGAGL